MPDSDSVEHRARRLVRAGERPRPKQRFVKELVTIGAIVAVAAVLAMIADVPRPGYPEARAVADDLDAFHRSVGEDRSSLEAAAADAGLSAHPFLVGAETVYVVTGTHPTVGGMCYGIRMGAGFVTSAVSFSGRDGCRPLSALSFEAIGSWDDVLPSPRMTPWWFVPVMVVLVGGVLWISTGIVLRMIGR